MMSDVWCVQLQYINQNIIKTPQMVSIYCHENKEINPFWTFKEALKKSFYLCVREGILRLKGVKEIILQIFLFYKLMVFLLVRKL